MFNFHAEGTTPMELYQKLANAVAQFGEVNGGFAPTAATKANAAAAAGAGAAAADKPKKETKKDEAPKVTYEEVSKAVMSIISVHGKEIGGPKAKALLAEYGAEKGGDLKEKDYPAVLAKAIELAKKDDELPAM